MRSAQRTRYYCDHCNRGSGSPSAMLRHEKGCTANPNRVCSMHYKVTGGCGPLPLKTLLEVFMNPALGKDWQERMKRLRDEADNCPACILATIRQSGVQKYEPDEDGRGLPDEMYWKSPFGDTVCLGFNFKEELKSAWEEHALHRGCREDY